MARALSVLSVSSAAEALYRHILRSAPATLADHAAHLGWSDAKAARELRQLLDAGLVHVHPDLTLQVDDPAQVLDSSLAAEEALLAERSRQLSQARAAITQFAADYRHGRTSPEPGLPVVETVPLRQATSLMAHAMRTRDRETRASLRNPVYVAELDDDVREVSAAYMRLRSRQRALYSAEALADQGARRRAAVFAELGSEQRLASYPLPDFIVFGDELVVTAADPGGPGTALVIRSLLLVAAYANLFEHAWQLSLPMPGSRRADPECDLISLLSAGLKDEAIARHLGWGVRTVRRRVAKLMDERGVATRFQLGAAAQRHGLLPVLTPEP